MSTTPESPSTVPSKKRPENKDALVRMWELLKLIPQKPPGLTVEELRNRLERDGYPVHERTVTRNLDALSTIFPITTTHAAQGESWHWIPDRDSGLPGVALSEAIALLLVEKSLTGLVHPNQLEPLKIRLEAAHRLVSGASRTNHSAAWVDKVIALPRDISQQPPEVQPGVSEAIQQALLSGNQVLISYKSFKDPGFTDRIVNPHALLLKAPVTYLIATPEPGGKGAPDPVIKQYALHRVRGATVLKTPARHGDFDLGRYVENQRHEIGSNELIDLKLRVNTPNMQTILREVSLGPGQEITETGGQFTVEVRVRHTRALERWIYARGAEVTVLEPLGLREKILADLKKAVATY